MDCKVIGESHERWDALSKVLGKARYTRDYEVPNAFFGKVLRSTIAHGVVIDYDISEAEAVPGVVKILLPEDVSQNLYSTAGHPWKLDPEERDPIDRNILTRRVRQYGDEIAAVIAETELAARQAIEKIRVTYEEYPVYLTPEESMAEGAVEIHKGIKKNILAHTVHEHGDLAAAFEKADIIIEDVYETPVQLHVHLEQHSAYAYQDDDQRWVCVSSTQVPHLCRQITAQALGIRFSDLRIIKPLIGGGFGNKQDVSLEPLTVAMSMAVGGKPVRLEFDCEETMGFTRTRHSSKYYMKVGVTREGKVTAIDSKVLYNQGAYGSHGHAVSANGSAFFNISYHPEAMRYDVKSVYTNIGTGGAMRGYGIPQAMFALESVMEDAARKLGMDSIEFRMKNQFPSGKINEMSGVTFTNNNMVQVFEKGKEKFQWETRQKNIKEFNGSNKKMRRGIGVASFTYSTGVWPFDLEVTGARLTLIQDGCFKLIVGATELGQGSDTVFRQMAAETIGVKYEDIHIDSVTDTDYAPFDTAAFASRQSYITGMAVKDAAKKMRETLLERAAQFLEIDKKILSITDGDIINKETGELLTTLSELAMVIFYHKEYAQTIVTESSLNVKNASYATGAAFAEVSVDLDTGEVSLLDLLNVHDSGVILNPQLAEGQVHGGMIMGAFMGLSEGLRYNAKGKPLNNNLLDYKVPTFLDVPDLGTDFIEVPDPIGPYGNKSLGENPIVSPAAAVRNAFLNATGVEINKIPLHSQHVFEQLNEKL